jgi:hypothetical protein
MKIYLMMGLCIFTSGNMLLAAQQGPRAASNYPLSGRSFSDQHGVDMQQACAEGDDYDQEYTKAHSEVMRSRRGQQPSPPSSDGVGMTELSTESFSLTATPAGVAREPVFSPDPPPFQLQRNESNSSDPSSTPSSDALRAHYKEILRRLDHPHLHGLRAKVASLRDTQELRFNTTPRASSPSPRTPDFVRQPTYGAVRHDDRLAPEEPQQSTASSSLGVKGAAVMRRPSDTPLIARREAVQDERIEIVLPAGSNPNEAAFIELGTLLVEEVATGRLSERRRRLLTIGLGAIGSVGSALLTYFLTKAAQH